MVKFPWSKNIRTYYTKHADFNAAVHTLTGIGVAWFVSLAWHYAVPVLIAGAIFFLVALVMEFHAYRTG